jgi:glycosyltransferase involved in cell wall biosynthesis
VVPIGSTAGGIKEVIKHESTGYLVDVGDSDSASKYAKKLLLDDNLYKEMQTKMLADVEQRFASDLIADQYEYYYRKMLEGNNE